MLKNKFKLLFGLAPMAVIATAVSCTTKVEEIQKKHDELSKEDLNVKYFEALNAHKSSQATKTSEYEAAKKAALQKPVDTKKASIAKAEEQIKLDKEANAKLNEEIKKLEAEGKDASAQKAEVAAREARIEKNNEKITADKEALKEAEADLAHFNSLFPQLFANYKAAQAYITYQPSKNEEATRYEFAYPIITNKASLDIIKEVNALKNSKEYKELATTNDKILYLSDYFLTYFDRRAKELDPKAKNIFGGIPYFADRMFGNADTKERLVALLNELDCFTYFDYVNAFLIDSSNTEKGFMESLIKTRYAESKISYSTRKHFFTDWGYGEVKSESNPAGTIKIANDLVKAITDETIRSQSVQTVSPDRFKRNGKIVSDPSAIGEKREEVLKTVPIVPREIQYIDADSVTDEFMSTHFKSGDLLMLAAKESLNDWLDLTHCGYLVIRDGKAYYRNASSRKSNLSVVEIPLALYLAQQNWSSRYNQPEVGKQRTTPGVLVFRTLDPQAQLDSVNSGN
ncbi:N-acetylmuramoyl-L-alanine amidase-like domain-containing protein [Mycoplasmopsis columboralis]|uniref:Protein of uncharacterized function (DUF1460) n=1 Tax=Mycoplasmopsis columboralis TaxID=171282 RepID=A0A449B5X6_9BACT|nr:N-acetylmuramoyl-L-alanine amidase-like domain-containing protein [Mycoplasmopsis columboralis]VEU75982.1 Protein of uncharacterised function (DUF1460) [Mycoplasmopsis columboralis]